MNKKNLKNFINARGKSISKRVNSAAKNSGRRAASRLKSILGRVAAMAAPDFFAGVFVFWGKPAGPPADLAATIPLRRQPAFLPENDGRAGRWPRLALARLSTQEQILFTKRLSILVKAGVPILQALAMLRDQASSRGAAAIMESLRRQVEQGQSLAGAMARHKRIFGDFAVNIVRVGEISGTLTQNLQYLADELKKSRELKRNIVSALIYPSFIVAATIGIASLLTIYVFPKILPVFQSFKTRLPWSTRVLISVSNFMRHDWAYLFLGAAAVAFAWWALLLIKPAKIFVDRNFLRLPILGSMFKDYYIANFTRTLGLLLKSDLGIIEALHITGSTMGNKAYRQSFDKIALGVVRGQGMSQDMKKDKLLYPPVVAQMASIGEMTGNLSSSLLYLAEMHEEELANKTKNLSTSIEPALMIVMGILVGFIAISIITPIYGITQSLHT